MSSYLSFIYEFTIFFPHIFLYHNCNKKSCKIVCGLRFFLLNLIKVMVFFFFFFLSFKYGSLVVHYSLNFTAYKAASKRVSLRCGTPKTLQKHAKVGQGCCQACLGCCKACLGRCKACLQKSLQYSLLSIVIIYC